VYHAEPQLHAVSIPWHAPADTRNAFFLLPSTLWAALGRGRLPRDFTCAEVGWLPKRTARCSLGLPYDASSAPWFSDTVATALHALNKADGAIWRGGLWVVGARPQTQFQGRATEEENKAWSRWFQAYLDTVLGNLQLCVTNVHVRYEDRVTQPGLPFAAGATLQSLEAFTVDASRGPTFVPNSMCLLVLRKVGSTSEAPTAVTRLFGRWHAGRHECCALQYHRRRRGSLYEAS
jgi:hypothetical protein